jgi:hypothetical protein
MAVSILTRGLGFGGPLVTRGLSSATIVNSFFEADLVAFLAASGYTVYPDRIPQKASLPALSFTVIDWDREYKLDGPTGLAQARVEIVVASPNYRDCGLISDSLRRLLVKIRYPMANTFIDACLLEDQSSEFAAPIDGSDKGVHTKSSDYLFLYTETF